VSLFQQVAETILRFKVDVADAKRGLKELQGEEKKAAEASIKLSEQQNNRIDSAAKAITKFNVVMKLGTEAINFASDAWKTYEKHALAAGGADASKARDFRSAMQTWDEGLNSLKVSIGRMVVALAPLVELAGRIIGYAADAIDFVAGGGLTVGAKNNAKSPEELRRALKQQFGRGGGGDGYLFDATRADQLARQVSAIAGSGIISASAIQTKQYVDTVRGNVQLDPLQQVALDFLRSQGYAAPFAGATGQNFFRDRAWKGFKLKKKKDAVPTEYDTESRDPRDAPGYFSDTLGAAGTDYGAQVGPARFGMDQLDYGAFGREAAASLDAFRKQTMLETIFGPPETFDLYMAKFELLKSGLDLFTGALQNHFDAWVSGSETLSEAVAAMGRDIVTGIASQLQAYAIREGVLALISLAAGDVRGAAQHGIAAGAAEAGAVGVGAIARHFNLAAGGGGAGGYAGGGGGTPRVTGGGGFGGSDGRSTVIYVGDYWTENPREQRQKTGRAIKAARREMESYEGVRDA